MKKGIIIIFISLLLVTGASKASYAADEDFPRVLHIEQDIE